MKTLTAILLAFALFLTGCGEDDPEEVNPRPAPEPAEQVVEETPEPDTTEEEAPEPEEQPEPATDENEELLLTGDWTGGDSIVGIEATIEDGVITIYDVIEDSRYLYWVGTAPETVSEGETFVSEADSKRLRDALLASQEDEKEFTYEDGELTYESGIMDVITTNRLYKE